MAICKIGHVVGEWARVMIGSGLLKMQDRRMTDISQDTAVFELTAVQTVEAESHLTATNKQSAQSRDVKRVDG